MARVKYGAFIDEISGSIGGTTFQRNAYGFTAKRKPNMVIPNTALQQRAQIHFSKATQTWRGLTDIQRNTWITFASTHPQYSNNNPTSQLSGYALFVKIQVWRYIVGVSTLNSSNIALKAIDTIALKLIVAAGVLTIDPTWLIGDESWYVIYSLSRVLGAAQNFTGTKPRFIIAGTSLNDNFNVTTLYTSLFGAIPAVGNRVAVDIQMFGENNGQFIAKQSPIITVTAV